MLATSENWDLAYADMAAHIALEAIGRKLTRQLPRSARGENSQLRQADTWQRHTIVRAHPDQIPHLTQGAFRFMERTIPNNPCLRDTIKTYVQNLVLNGTEHRRDGLVDTLDGAGCLQED